MQKKLKKTENYFVDRTYHDNAGNGTIEIVTKNEAISKGKKRVKSKSVKPSLKKSTSFVSALISFRWTISGGVIVLTRQPDTSDETYKLAKSLKQEMQKDLLKNNRFVNDFEAFKVWIGKQITFLKQNGFHDLKTSKDH